MQLTPRIHIVASGKDGFSLTHRSDCHVYLIDGGSELALIDAGAGVDQVALLDRLDATGSDRDRVRRLFLTHAHADHAGGTAGLRETLGLEVMASPEVAAIVRAGDEVAASVHIGRAQGTYAPEYRYRPSVIDHELADGQLITVGDVTVEVIATPGHATGHLAYIVHDRTRADLFTGDTLLYGGTIVLQNTWDCDLHAHLETIRRLGRHRHDGLFPGHLAFSVSDGERHIQAALAALDRGAIPPTF